MRLRSFYKIPPAEWLLTANPDVAAARRRAEDNPAQDQFAIEKYVRQWILKELVETYGYPAEWFGERLVVEESVQMATMVKQADVSIKNDRHKTFLFIETKRSGVSSTDYDAAEAQLMGYLSSTHTATIGMVTDGVTTKCLVKKIDPNDFDYIPDIPDYDQKDVKQKSRLVRELTPEMVAEGRKTGLTPLTEGLEDILFRAHSAIRDIDGLHADEALDELSKVIYAKIYDERLAVDSDIGAVFRFQTYGAGNTEEIASNIRDLYKEANDRDLSTYSQRIPGYERSRGVFRQQIRLSSPALVKVVETLQNYSIVDTHWRYQGQGFPTSIRPRHSRRDGPILHA